MQPETPVQSTSRGILSDYPSFEGGTAADPRSNGDASKSAAGKSSNETTGNGGVAKNPPEAKLQQKKDACATCGRKDHYCRCMTFKDCPALQSGKRCRICGKEGYFASTC